jgi:hypothetical protein
MVDMGNDRNVAEVFADSHSARRSLMRARPLLRREAALLLGAGLVAGGLEALGRAIKSLCVVLPSTAGLLPVRGIATRTLGNTLWSAEQTHDENNTSRAT